MNIGAVLVTALAAQLENNDWLENKTGEEEEEEEELSHTGDEFYF